VNAGSSSLKLSVLDDDDHVLHAVNEHLERGEDPGPVIQRFLNSQSVDVAGHRVVHGGDHYREPVVIGDDLISNLDHLISLAPLHNPPAVRAIEALQRLRPELPAVACFDTAFHATIPPDAYTYAVPADWGVRRYGFHGLSYEWASNRAAELLGRPVESLRMVACHLGAGASLCAIDRGKSVDTTMGYTPLEGLVMATRSGSIDPGAVLEAQRRLGLSASETEEILNRRSGLLALAGTPDMREVEGLALGVYLHRLRALIAAMAAALNGLDVLVFSGGVGERSAIIREQTCAGLTFLDVAIDGAANSAVGDDDVDISASESAVRTLVVHAREDVIIARAARRLVDLG
jgi:acetate kinase